MSSKKRKLDTIEEPSLALKSLDALQASLGITQTITKNVKASNSNIQTNTVPVSRKFDPKEDGFFMSTQMVKRVCSVFDIFKDNVECNIQFSENGINVFALYYDKTVCICTHLGRDLFSEFSCNKEVVSCVNLNVFAKKLSTLQLFKPQKITFSNRDHNLIITGYPENAAKGEALINSLSSSLEELDVTNYEYDVNIRVLSSEFAKMINAMPASFTLSMDCAAKQLVFEGKEDQSSILLRLDVDPDIVHEIEKYEDVANYKACFLSTYLQPIVKGSKMCTYAIIAFRRETPLFVRYIINESSDLNPENNSKISMYFASKFDESMDDM
jgi:hypothetical protein